MGNTHCGNVFWCTIGEGEIMTDKTWIDGVFDKNINLSTNELTWRDKEGLLSWKNMDRTDDVIHINPTKGEIEGNLTEFNSDDVSYTYWNAPRIQSFDAREYYLNSKPGDPRGEDNYRPLPKVAEKGADKSLAQLLSEIPYPGDLNGNSLSR